MDEQSIIAIKNNNLLKNADISKLNFENINGKLHTVSGGEILYREGESADSLYLIVNGEVNLLKKKEDGKSKSIVYEDNDFFGGKELLDKIERCSTTISLMDTYLLELTQQEIDYLIKQDEIIAQNIKKWNNDFEVDNSNNNLVEEKIINTFDEESELLDEFLTDNDIDDIIGSIEQQEEIILENINDFDEDILIKYKEDIKSAEIDDNIDRENHNSMREEMENIAVKEIETNNKETKENFMSSEQFEMIVKALQLVNANVKQDDVLKNVIDVAVNLTNADRGTLYLVDKNNNEIWSKVLIGEEVEEIRLKIGNGIAGWVAENGETLNIPDVDSDDRFDSSVDELTGYITKNMLVYPIKDKNEQVVGVLQLLNSIYGKFGKQEEIFLNAISLNIAFALENASLVEQLVESERNNYLGKIGNFLAYDIKKPILISKRYAEHLSKKDLPIEIKQILNLMLEQLEQVSNQVATASDFTEGTTILRRQSVSLNDTLHEFMINIHNLLKTNNCRIEHSLGEDVDVFIDKKEFYQCYYNIVKNACEALPEGGNIFITTKNNDDKIDISFDDKGIGIESNDIKYIFDPLWTKNKSNNSGLGLSISKKIVEDHEGNISVKSEKNNGTTVIISLPIN